MNDVIERLRTGFVSSEAFGKIRMQAADLIEQQQKRIAELEAEVSNTEQRTAEACAKAAEELRHPDGYSGENPAWCEGTQHAANAIRNGEWKEYL